MPKGLLPCAVLVAGVATFSIQPAGSEEIPNFSGGWARIGDQVEMFEPIPGYDGPGPMQVDPEHPHVDQGYGIDLQWIADLTNPILNASTLEDLKQITDHGLQQIPHLKDESVCRFSGAPMLWNRRGTVIVLQTATEVKIMNPRDNQVRTVFLDAPHGENLPHSWYGESVGHYEGGDTLVIDTIAQNGETQIDRFGTPHSDRIHLSERVQLLDGGSALEVRFTVEDPGAFTVPWSARVRHRQVGYQWEEVICAENNRFVGESTFRGLVVRDDSPMPGDLTPDF
jgi:hypothetical protein